MDISGGWSKTPHFITDAMADMSLTELACTILLIRETYGWQRSWARLTYKDFRRRSAIKSKSAIAVALNDVEMRGFFRRTGQRSIWQIVAPEEGREDAADCASADKGSGGAPAPAPSAVLDDERQDGRERRQKRHFREDRPAEDRMPKPRSAKQRTLAAHPAAAAWLESGMAWPGWQGLMMVVRRMGRQPQAETLRKARRMWMMHRFR